MKRTVDIGLSKQGTLLNEQMPDLDLEDLTDWYCSIKGIFIGGADIIDYLNYKKQKEAE